MDDASARVVTVDGQRAAAITQREPCFSTSIGTWIFICGSAEPSGPTAPSTVRSPSQNAAPVPTQRVTEKLFTAPADARTEGYITGRFG